MRSDISYGLWQLYGELAKHSLTHEQACLLQGSGSRGAKATRKQELSRALKLERAGLPVDTRSGLYRQPSGSRASHHAAAAVCGQDPSENGTSHQLQLGLAGPSGDVAAATMLPDQQDAISDGRNDSDGLETSADDSAAQPSPTKRQKLGQGSTPSSWTADESHASDAAASGLADVRTALKQSRAELGLPGEGTLFALPGSAQQLMMPFLLSCFASLVSAVCTVGNLLPKYPIANQPVLAKFTNSRNSSTTVQRLPSA